MIKLQKLSCIMAAVVFLMSAALAAAQGSGPNIKLVNNGSPVSAQVNFVLKLGVKGTANTSSTGNVTIPDNILSSVKPHTSMTAYQCDDGSVYVVEAGAQGQIPCPEKKRRKLVAFWWDSGQPVVIDTSSSATTTTMSSTSETPKVELFGGYSYLRVNPGFDSNGFNFNGGSGSVAYNFMPWLGVVGDFGGYHWSQNDESSNVFTYLFGPKIAMRRGPITPFGQVLFGGARISDSESCSSSFARVHSEGGPVTSCSSSSNAFAMALGGGVDWNATDHIGIRLIQAEYLMTRFVSNTQNNARISMGVVFRF